MVHNDHLGESRLFGHLKMKNGDLVTIGYSDRVLLFKIRECEKLAARTSLYG